jgi:hypothetical protein
MSLLRGFAIAIVSSVLFGLLGGLLGWVIGAVAPDYYHTVFHIPAGSEVNTAALGFGLGVTQGAGTGLVAGLILVAVVAWYNSRMTKKDLIARLG